ncbi:MAG: ATP-binding protein [Ignavibacteriae bacterium]|nr:MAG: ATP-binding protein [Ignavibacteriota bacterium]
MKLHLNKRLFQIIEGYRKYQFEIRHLIVLALVLITFQFVVLYLNQNSLQQVFVQSQQWYQQDEAERIANLTATSLELLLASKSPKEKFTESEGRQIVQDYNIIFSQQLLNKNVKSICILIPQPKSIIAIDDGQQLFDYLFGGGAAAIASEDSHAEAIRLFSQLKDSLIQCEQTITVLEGQQIFHVFMPFVPRGEFIGVVYMKITPNLSFLTQAMSSNYDKTAFLYSGLIIIGLFAMFYISTRTLHERNKIQRMYFEEQKKFLTEQINHQNEMLFTKRIYHTHHKAEKIGGFISEDLRILTAENIDQIKYRIDKYSSFIARVIYDMKWYNPPIHTIRGPMFKTNVNVALQFIVENIFKRVSKEYATFELHLDPAMPDVAINEYVIWEVFEPIIQNALDHSGNDNTRVIITTTYNAAVRRSVICIEDNGKGVDSALLELDASGVKKIFLDHVTSGEPMGKQHSGYGCYIAYEIATQRFGWSIDVENKPAGGCKFTFTMNH